MTRDELIECLKDHFQFVNEGIQAIKSQNKYPRVVYWDYVWALVPASGDGYDDLNTYQVSIFSKYPPRQTQQLLSLRNDLLARGEMPTIYHEYIDSDQVWHSYFSLSILE